MIRSIGLMPTLFCNRMDKAHASDQIAAFMHEGNDVEMLRWFEVHECIEVMLAEAPFCPVD
jgi:hypothetical protein